LPDDQAPFELRRAGAGDSEGILACLRAAFERYRNDYTPGAFADTVLDPEKIQERLRHRCVFVAVAQREVIGTVACEVHGAQGHLRGLAVSPDWQGTGAASALLRAAEHQLRNEGCTLVTLDTTQPLKRAIRFYERHGFSASGNTADFFGMRLHQYSKRL
jgi:ribosomal protein S18 acetylase RimI-like enzyme